VKIGRGISDAASEVKDTAEKIGTSVQWNTAALVAVTIVAVVALVVATASFGRSSR
jgi:hypothetical protein